MTDLENLLFWTSAAQSDAEAQRAEKLWLGDIVRNSAFGKKLFQTSLLICPSILLFLDINHNNKKKIITEDVI